MAIKKNEIYSSLWASCDKLRGGMDASQYKDYMCDRINEHYPSKIQKEDWQWRTPFKTSTVEIDEDLSKEAIFAGLDECLKEIQAFEADLKQKLEL